MNELWWRISYSQLKNARAVFINSTIQNFVCLLIRVQYACKRDTREYKHHTCNKRGALESAMQSNFYQHVYIYRAVIIQIDSIGVLRDEMWKKTLLIRAMMRSRWIRREAPWLWVTKKCTWQPIVKMPQVDCDCNDYATFCW